MRCTECFTYWTNWEDYKAHIDAHNKINGVTSFGGLSADRSKWDNSAAVTKEKAAHAIGKCDCRMIGVRFVCEMVARGR